MGKCGHSKELGWAGRRWARLCLPLLQLPEVNINTRVGEISLWWGMDVSVVVACAIYIINK